MNISISYLLCLLLALGIVLGNGQEQSSNEQNSTSQHFQHPLTDMPGPSEDVVTSHYFPSHPDQKIPIGENVVVLCHFANDGKTPLNVTAIMGSLNSPYDFNYYVQNFTYKPLGVVVKGGEEITFEYQFQVHPMLEPVDFTFASVVFYESDELMYSNTFFNQTIELYLPISDWDFSTIVQLLSAILSTAVVGFMVYYGCMADKPLPFTLAGPTKRGYAAAYEEESEKIDATKVKKSKNKRN